MKLTNLAILSGSVYLLGYILLTKKILPKWTYKPLTRFYFPVMMVRHVLTFFEDLAREKNTIQKSDPRISLQDHFQETKSRVLVQSRSDSHVGKRADCDDGTRGGIVCEI